MSKIHPEMLPLIEEEMRRELVYWKTTSPKDVVKRIRKRLLEEQKPLKNARQGLEYEVQMTCDCQRYMDLYIIHHNADCVPKYKVKFHNTKEKTDQINYQVRREAIEAMDEMTHQYRKPIL